MTLKLRLVRDECGTDCQFGKLYAGDQFLCSTLEDVVREVAGSDVAHWKVPGCTAIPRGTYRVMLTLSARFKRVLPLLIDVPGYSGVRIHSGNRAADTHGCILVGRLRGRDHLVASRDAFDELFELLRATTALGEDVTLEIV